MSWTLLTVELAARKKFGKSMQDLTAEEQEELKKAFKSGEFARKEEESMNIKEIAHKLMALREGMSAFILSGQLREELGFDGYKEALNRRWIMADQEGSGMTQITNHLGAVAEMRQLAEEFVKEEKDGEECTFCHKKGCDCTCEKCPECKKANCTCEGVSESQIAEKVMSWTTFTRGNEKYHYDDRGAHQKGEAPKERRNEASPVIAGDAKKPKRKWWHSESAHFLAQAHAFRTKPGLNEIATMGLGNPDRLGTPPAQPTTSTPAPAAPPAAAPAAQKAADVAGVMEVAMRKYGREFTTLSQAEQAEVMREVGAR
jgi:hypothetical protein